MKESGNFVSRNDDFNKTFGKQKLLQYLVKTENPTIFDVGAHKGESVDLFLSSFSNPQIHCFEPGDDAFSQLVSKFSKNSQVSLNQTAIHEEAGVKKFYLNSLSHTNSFFKVNENSKDSISLNSSSNAKDSFKTAHNKEITVKTTRLDDYCQTKKIQKIDVLKVDVQGAESHVLKSLGQYLAKVKLVLVEISFFDYYENRTSFNEIESILGKEFKLYSIIEISQNPMNGRTDWVTAVYSR